MYCFFEHTPIKSSAEKNTRRTIFIQVEFRNPMEIYCFID